LVSNWVSKISLQLLVLAGLRMIVAPGISTLMLITSTYVLDVRFNDAYVALAIISGLLCWIFMSPLQERGSGPYSSTNTILSRTGLSWLAVVGCVLLIAYATKTSDIFSRRALFFWFLATPPVLIAASLMLRYWLRIAMMSSSHMRNAAIVGLNSMSLELIDILKQRPELGFKLKCIFDDSGIDATGHEHRTAIIRDFNRIPAVVNARGIDVVFIAQPAETERTQTILSSLRDTTSSVYLIPDISIFDLIQARSDDIHGIPVIALCESPFQGSRALAKRATDIVFASLLLLLAVPVMLAISLGIKLTSPGRVIFKQDRYGLDGHKIVVYKFRTMTVLENGGEIVQAQRDDPRVTPFGRFLRKTSLDELPQIINVLQGRMSLVGPRPHAVAHNEEYRKLISGYMVRHKVVPGITGLAQINGCRGETTTLDDMKRRVEYDLEYLRHWCWLLDIKILLNTCALLIRDKHAY
jgi:putative colanic acid biosynthesis UDP-glucose lipid carrier transferase